MARDAAPERQDVLSVYNHWILQQQGVAGKSVSIYLSSISLSLSLFRLDTLYLSIYLSHHDLAFNVQPFEN